MPEPTIAERVRELRSRRVAFMNRPDDEATRVRYENAMYRHTPAILDALEQARKILGGVADLQSPYEIHSDYYPKEAAKWCDYFLGRP